MVIGIGKNTEQKNIKMLSKNNGIIPFIRIMYSKNLNGR